MAQHRLTKADQELVEDAKRQIGRVYVSGHHSVAAALRTSDGEVFTAVNVEAPVGGGGGCCAELSVLSAAISEGEQEYDVIVAFKHRTGVVIPPCGVCRETLSVYAPDVKVIVRDGDELIKLDAADLLPYPFEDNARLKLAA